MKLNQNSRLIRFAYWPDNRGWALPAQTTLCALFWRCVFRVVIAAFALFVVGAYGYSWFTSTWNTLLGTLGFLAVFVVVGIFEWLGNRARLRQLDELNGIKRQPSVIAEAIWGIKNRICPIIHIEREG